MKLRDCKVGDVILLYLNEDGFPSTVRTPRTMKATIFAHSPESDYDEELYYLGWKSGEKVPCGASPRRWNTNLTAKTQVHNQKEYTYRVFGYPDWEVGGVADEVPVSLPQWKLFVNNKDGECPCGTNRAVCKYHG